MSTKSPNIIAIVPAAGNGQRMQSVLPKQYIKIGHATILEHTLQKLLSLPLIHKIIVVLSPSDNYFSTLNIASNPKISTTIGGATRADSVLAGLNMIEDDSWALVHDAARPCIEINDIEKLFQSVLDNNQGGILASKIVDTVKKSINNSHNSLIEIEQTCDRQFLWAAATPQMFKAMELRDCLAKAKHDHVEITDEASAIEYCGGNPLLVECRRNNIKVTSPDDVPVARLYLQEQGYIDKNSLI